tara:strand:- start:661 stop:933 length:273 start_codon:yes stop_codon:yes gene_type:complete
MVEIMRNFLIGIITTLLIIIAVSGTLICKKLIDIEDSMAEMQQKIIVMDKEFDNNVTIKTDKLDKALNEFMINAFNAANSELKKNMEGNK